jgi:hypothetical protein
MNMSVSTTAGLPGAQAYDRPTAGEDAHTILINRVSWGAIFAGVVVGLVVQVLLTMLGVGIGVATLDPGAGDNPAVSTFSIATGVWYVLSGIIAAPLPAVTSHPECPARPSPPPGRCMA